MRGRIRSIESRRGAALIVSLITVMVIASLGAGLIQLQSALDKKHAFSIDRRRALYIAEAGLAEAALAVSQGKSGIIASEAVPAAYGGGLFWVESIDLPEDRIALVCTARIGTAEFVLRTLVLPNLNPVASLGFFGTQGVEIGWGTVGDGYHSARGTFATQLDLSEPVATTGDFLLVGSNGDILLEEGAWMSGYESEHRDGESSELEGAPGGEGGSEKGGEGGGESIGSSGGGSQGHGGGSEGPGGSESSEGAGGPGGGFSWSTVLGESGESGSGGSPGGESGGGSSDPLGDVWGSSGGGGATPPLVAPPGSPTRLYGRLRPGVDGVVLSNGFSLVDGRIQKYHEVPRLPAVTPPVVTETITGTFTVTGSRTGVGDDVDTRVTGDLHIVANSTLTLFGPKVLDVRVLRLEAGATLELDDSNGPILIVARQGVECAASSDWVSLAPEATARGTSILVAQVEGDQERVTLPGSGTFRGILYAPSDTVVLPAGLRWFGSAVARQLRSEPGARLTYDRRFAIGGDGVPTLPRILSWQIVPIGDGLARHLAVDPVFALQLQGVVPVSPTDATPETDCEVQYVDVHGNEAVHGGTFATLNLADVDRIVAIRWIDSRDATYRSWLRPAGEDPSEVIDIDRGTLERLRETVLVLGGETKVASLNDAQIVEMISKVPPEKLASQGADVVAASERNSAAVDMTKYVDGADNVKWSELLDDVSTRKDSTEDTSDGVVGVPPGGP